MAQAGTDRVLFFIPDISGFTKFVSETEINHSRHIIQGLLEALVDANSIGLAVGEFEGDAILFYRPGAPPSAGEMVEQARRMFVAFHTLLKKIELSRVCQCGACSGATGLTLKIVAHHGPAGEFQVKGQTKFIGTSIIVAHRLLKNSVPDREYLLLTREVAGTVPDESLFRDGVDKYDEIGEIRYRYFHLGRYLDEVRVDPPEPVRVPNPAQVMELSRRIGAPPKRVFQTIADLPARMKWIEGIRKVELPDRGPNHLGTHHVCVRGSGDPEMVTSAVKVSDDRMELWETDVRRMASSRYILDRRPDGGTDLRLQFFVRGNPIVKWVFRLFMERKLRQMFEKSLDNLAALCEADSA